MTRKVYQKAGVEIEDLPKGVYLEWRDGFMVGVNYTDNAIDLKIPTGKKILVGENPLRPTQAVIWKN